MTEQTTIDRPSELDAITISSLVQEYREGRNPFVTYVTATHCLNCLGRPLSEKATKELIVSVSTLGGRSVGRLADFVAAADRHIERRMALPNLKAKAAATARAARKVVS